MKRAHKAGTNVNMCSILKDIEVFGILKQLLKPAILTPKTLCKGLKMMIEKELRI